MAATPVTSPSPGPPPEEDEGRKQQHQRVPNGYVMIVVPNAGHELPASSLPHDADAPEDEEERPRPPGATSSLWLAAVLALAAVAVAGYVCLYAGRLLETREDDGGDDDPVGGRRSFLLPLYPKPRRGGATKRASGDDWPQNSTGNLFPEGLYYTTISLGNPPRPYFLDVDTGSHATWIQCDAPCTSCAKGAHPVYRPARTNLVPASDPLCDRVQHDNPNQCDYDISYADGSSSMGVHVRDNMQFISEGGERENADIVFGCGYDQQGILLNRLENTDGILGLSNQALSLPTQLASRGTISNAFGHCVTRDPSGGGYLFLGDDYIPRWGMTWVPIRDGPADDIRRAQVQQVNHGDQQLNVQGKLTQVIFDSGSTYTYFPNEALINLISSLKAASPRFVQDDSDKTLPFCMKADFPVRSVDDVKYFFKPLSLQFEKRFFFSRTFNIRPEDYLIISDKGNVCLGVLDGTTIGYDSVIIVGDVSLRGKLIAYDNDENEVGWIDSDCTNPRRPSRIPSFLRRALHNQLL
ncbi:aspartyl protease APCB1-like [Miscanthus floridulus]|uniref:aspartyl protease APCB1-like n=1 Tax=Miscanthus floridulus TaxID=154761 RepID=UPI0034586FA6